MSGFELKLERTFDAPREAVFEAWTNPEVMRRWWAAGTDWGTPTADVDLRQGGRILVSMAEPGGEPVHTFSGEYLEVSPPERLVFTVDWEGEEGKGAVSRLTVEFHEDGDRTRVVLTNTGLASEEARDSHEHGWRECLDNLDRRVFPASAT